MRTLRSRARKSHFCLNLFNSLPRTIHNIHIVHVGICSTSQAQPACLPCDLMSHNSACTGGVEKEKGEPGNSNLLPSVDIHLIGSEQKHRQRPKEESHQHSTADEDVLGKYYVRHFKCTKYYITHVPVHHSHSAHMMMMMWREQSRRIPRTES